MSALPSPRYIALCGNPKSGKSTAAELLRDAFGFVVVDDGFVLRDFAMRHLGASEADVMTQEGKASLAHWPNGEPIIDYRTGQHMTWRLVLGRLGEQLELLFGDYAMPRIATARLENGAAYVFPSVRKTQPWYFAERGGLVIGIRNPIAGPSGNAFDVFDEQAVDVWIENDGLARGLDPETARADLLAKLMAAIAQWQLDQVMSQAKADEDVVDAARPNFMYGDLATPAPADLHVNLVHDHETDVEDRGPWGVRRGARYRQLELADTVETVRKVLKNVGICALAVLGGLAAKAAVDFLLSFA